MRRRRLALLAHLLAVARAERRQEVVEALERAVGAVVPVELHGQPRQVAGAARARLLGLGAEQEVDRRDALVVGDLPDAAQQLGGHGRRVGVRGARAGAGPVTGVNGIAATSFG